MRQKKHAKCAVCPSCHEGIVAAIDDIIRRRVASRALTLDIVKAFVRHAVEFESDVREELKVIEDRLKLVLIYLDEADSSGTRTP